MANLLAGAYSTQYRTMERQHIEHIKQLAENENLDAIARSKKLTLETNKRRKAQSDKRKQEADKEEKRRKLILQKRRELQREATEKYQRSHIASHRPHSQNGNSSPARALDEALRIVRKSSSTLRHHSARPRSPKHRTYHRENSDPLNRAYVNKYAHSNRPASPGSPKTKDPNKLHNNSLRNLTSSKSLFEQQLEQQQQYMLEQHQNSLRQLNAELNGGMENEQNVQGEENYNYNQEGFERSESLSSVDSLEESNSQDSLQQSYDLSYSQVQKTSNYTNNDNSGRSNVSNISDTNMTQNAKYVTNGNGGWSYTGNQVATQNGTHHVNEKPTKIDSFGVGVENSGYTTSQTILPQNSSFQQTYGQQKEQESRPKAQVRAWVTPSPVEPAQDQSKNNYGAQNLVTKSSPYSSRSTLTTVTTTTPYSKGESVQSPQQYTQSNGWNDETMNLQQQYTSYQHQNDTPAAQNSPRNMEFLETVTNNLNQNEAQPLIKPHPPPTQAPRPMSAHRSNLNTVSFVNGGHVYRQPLQIASSTGNVRQQAPQSSPISVVSPTTSSPLYSNNASNVVKAATSPKVTMGVVNGKIAVLPDKPSAPVTFAVDNLSRQEARKNQVTVMKSKDDSVINTTKSEIPGVKGILKRPGSKNTMGGTLRKAGSTGNMSNVRDSIELTRTQLRQELEKPKKKSVRFSEFNDYAEHEPDEREDIVMDDSRLFTRRLRAPGTMIQKPPRPVSAKITSQTVKVEPQIRIPRVASAGPTRIPSSQQKHKSTIRPQAAAHIITHNSGSTYETTNTDNYSMPEKKVTVVSNNFMEKVPATHYTTNQNFIPPYSATQNYVYNVQNSQHAGGQNYEHQNGYGGNQNGYGGKENSNPAFSNSPPSAGSMVGKYNNVVYDENGLRIDRTPTDEEINFLWDKVRTCLNRNSTAMESQRSQNFPNDQSALPRQAAQLSQTLIDGSALGQLNTATRVGPSYSQPYVNQAAQSQQQQRGKTNGGNTSQNNGYSQRYALLQQRQKQNPNNLNKSNSSQRQYLSYHVPINSNKEPQQITPGYQPPSDASESLAAFMTAEQLAQQSVSESQINNAMEEAQSRQKAINANKPAQKVPTALSIEEQRLIESLDRLNDKLKITEFPDNLPSTSAPKTIVYSGGFRGSKPLMTQQRQRPSSDTTRSNVRGTSAHGVRTQNLHYT